MDECKGDWDSFITWTKRNGKPIPPAQQVKVSDGTIKIEAHGSATNIKGKHKKAKERDIKSGQCAPDGHGKTVISFNREDDENGATETFVYSGTVTGNKIKGKVGVPGGGPSGGDTGTWESDKTGGGGGGASKGGGKGKSKPKSRA